MFEDIKMLFLICSPLIFSLIVGGTYDTIVDAVLRRRRRREHEERFESSVRGSR